MPSAAQRIAAEAAGTAFLLAVVVGSGIMAERLSGGNTALALLANSVATGAGLYAFVVSLQAFGAHFNPAVTLLALWRQQLGIRLAVACMGAQFAGAIVGVLCAHAMFAEPLLQVSAKDRTGWSLAFAEFVATAGLLAVVSLAPRRGIAAAVAAYITAAYWFTASTSFANPAVTVARALTASFAGIAWRACWASSWLCSRPLVWQRRWCEGLRECSNRAARQELPIRLQSACRSRQNADSAWLA